MRKRKGKRERKARNAKRRASVWFKPAGESEYVRLKVGKRKSAKVSRMLFKPVSR